MLVWLNGRVLPAARARVAALDRGLLHGDGAYDTWRTYAGEPFAVAAHVRRLAAAARALGLPAPGPPTLWAARSRLLVRRSGFGDAAVRLTITRGAAGEAPLATRAAPPTRLLTVRPLPADLARRQARGIAAVLLPFPRSTAAPWGAFKLVGNPSAVVGRRLAARRRADEGLYVAAGGTVTEGTTTNVFALTRRGLVTPPADGVLLAGVTRDLVLRLARAAGIPVHEAPLRAAALGRAAELFVTASTVEILPVVRLDGRPIADARPGPVTRRLQALYAAHVARVLAGGGAARVSARVAGAAKSC
ncbi:MAG TPA: aminotransferase class IV [Candidatus Binatia bacterium]|nr:aminotransferase class IV [Candidatus Binatia bacterium]